MLSAAPGGDGWWNCDSDMVLPRKNVGVEVRRLLSTASSSGRRCLLPPLPLPSSQIPKSGSGDTV